MQKSKCKMQNSISPKAKSKRGFTLIELLVVIAIIAILAAIGSSVCAETLVIQPGPDEGKDAYVYNQTPDTNWGSDPSLIVGDISQPQPGPVHRWELYVQFDLSPLEGKTVDTAVLALYCYADGYNGQTERLMVFRVIQAWGEETITWNNQPQVDGSQVLNKGLRGVGWHEIDVTNFVKRWLGQGQPPGRVANHGLHIHSYDSAPYGYFRYWSSDYLNDPSLRPQLVVTYH